MDRGHDPDAAMGDDVSDCRTYAEMLSGWRDEEFSWLVEQLRFTGGNVTAVAKRAGIPRRSVYRLLVKYDLDPEIYR